MRRLFFKALVFALFNAAGFTLLQHWDPSIASDSFFSAMLDKEARLRESTPPRVLLIGGSNVAFGFDSGAISRETGYPTLNLALTGDLGRQFICNQAEANARSGDLIVFAPEYSAFESAASKGVRGNAHTLWIMAELSSRAIRYFGPAQWKAILDDGLTIAAGGIRRSVDVIRGTLPYQPDDQTPYRRSAFDREGDVVGHHLLAPNPATRAAKLLRPLELQISSDEIEAAAREIAEFVARCRARGSLVCFQFPPISEDSFNGNRETIAAIRTRVGRIPGLTVLNEPAETAYPKELFFDTYYHLRQAGSDRRTHELLVALRLHKLCR